MQEEQRKLAQEVPQEPSLPSAFLEPLPGKGEAEGRPESAGGQGTASNLPPFLAGSTSALCTGRKLAAAPFLPT